MVDEDDATDHNKARLGLRARRRSLLELVTPWIHEDDHLCAVLTCKRLHELLSGACNVRISIGSATTSISRLEWAIATVASYPGSDALAPVICAAAAERGALDILRHARLVMGLAWDGRTTFAAATGGHENVLRFAREHGCEWHENACAIAAARGDLSALQLLRRHECPWGSETCRAAAAAGKLEVLEWCRTEQPPCPWSAPCLLSPRAASYDRP